MESLRIADIPENDMREMIRSFPDLLRIVRPDREMIETAEEASKEGLRGVCFVGMGGSSISGEYVRALLSDISPVPIVIARDYSLPAFVDKNWVVLAVSYSGNTEETLSSYREAKRRSCRVFSITTGGQLEAISVTRYTQRIPAGLQPRAALPLLLSLTLGLTQRLLSLTHTDFNEVSRRVALSKNRWGKDIEHPEVLAAKLADSVPIFIAHGHLRPVAYRAKCQVNENAKHVAFCLEMPEANHNEVEASASYKRFSIRSVFLESTSEGERMTRRFDATKAVMASQEHNTLSVPNESKLEEMLALTFYLDTVSLELAEIGGVDAASVDRISKLKSLLAE